MDQIWLKKYQPIINSFRSFLKQRCSASAFLDPVTDDNINFINKGVYISIDSHPGFEDWEIIDCVFFSWKHVLEVFSDSQECYSKF